MPNKQTADEDDGGAALATDLVRVSRPGVGNVKLTAQAIAARALLDAGFAEAVQDVVGAMTAASNGVRVTYDDTAGTITFDAQEIVNAQTGTSYTYLTGDRGKLVSHSNAAAIAGTLAQAGSTGFPSGWWMDVQNTGAGTLTITPTTSTVDGAATLALTTGQGTRLVSDGTNWFTQRGIGSVTSGGTELKYLTLTSDTSSQADSDPGNGLMKWNNATQASATVLFMDNQTLDAVSLTTFYGNLVAGGFIYLQQSDDASKWQLWKVTTVTSASGYYKFTVALQASGGSIANSKTVYVLFQNGASSGSTQGKHAIFVAAGSISPSVTGGCAALAAVASGANLPDIRSLDFDATTQEFAQFALTMPKSWNEGTITFAPIWSHAATATNFGVVWQLQGIAVSDNEAIGTAYGTAQTSTDTGGTTDKLYMGPESSAITIAGSPAAQDTVFLRVARVPADGSDTMAIDARLVGIVVYITTDAETDA